jgi:signal transduction histidine kinase
MKTTRRVGLRLVLGLVGFGVLAAVAVLAVEWQRGSARALAEAQTALTDRAEDVAEHITRDLQERQRALASWVALDVVQDLAVDDVDKRLSATLRALARDLEASDLAIAIDIRGRVVASSDSANIGTLLTHRFPQSDTLNALPANGELAVIKDANAAMWFVVAAYAYDDAGRTIGRLALLAPISALVRSHLDALTIRRLQVDAPGGPVFRGDNAERITSDEFVIGRAEVNASADLPLRIGLAAPRAEVLAPVRDARRSALLVGAAVLVVLVPLALLLAHSASRDLAKHEALATLGTMAAGLAHEIRTPLGVLRTSVDLLARGGDESRRAELGGIVREETDRLDRLVEDLLAFARPRAPVREHADLADCVRGAETLLTSLCARHGAQLVLNAESAKVSVDVEQLRQVLLNLVDNGARAAGQAGTVTVSTRVIDGVAELAVRDSGPGVPVEIRTTLWDPFVTSRRSGTGLGLAIVRRIVEAHQGEVRLISPPEGGADFRLTFPLA